MHEIKILNTSEIWSFHVWCPITYSKIWSLQAMLLLRLLPVGNTYAMKSMFVFSPNFWNLSYMSMKFSKFGNMWYITSAVGKES
jgi:hypothetical protein